VEFADYREYARGDDLRRVDWNIYARLERPFVKLFEEEEDLAVHVLVDGSGSMGWRGEGEREGQRDKWDYARRLAAALGYVALVGGDRLQVALLRSGEVAARFGPVRGQGNALRLFEWLEGLEAEGTTDLNAALRAYGFAGGRAGLAVLISDLFSPTGYVEGLTALAARGHEVALLHLLTPDEVDPPLGGDLRLVDVETGEVQEVTVDGGMRNLYRRRLAAWQEEIRAACRARDGLYVPLTTAVPLDRALLHDLRRARLLR
jgi:uncharacterized protein (DUF58 family)